jgi:PadR family transcriptional regulator PadR
MLTMVYVDVSNKQRRTTLKKEKLPTRREAVILSILINGEKYGREIRNEYEERTGRKMPLGSLYTTLSRMEEYGFVKSWMGESVHERGGNKRKYFAVKTAGHRAINAYEIFITNVFGGTLKDV